MLLRGDLFLMDTDSSQKERPTILIADDMEHNRIILGEFLRKMGYNVIVTCDGQEALDKTYEFYPDVLLLDVIMPKLNGFEVTEKLKHDEHTKIIPIVLITALNELEHKIKAMECGADDFLNKPYDEMELGARVRSLLRVSEYNHYMRNYQKELEQDVAKKTKELSDALDLVKHVSLETIHRLTSAAEYKDDETGDHIKRIGDYTAVIAKQIGFSPDEIENLLYAAPMHDIGKIGVPDRILLKPGKLDDEEWEIMKKHTDIGAQILKGSSAEYIKLAELIAYSHHERWDGTGYPLGLAGEDIPLAGRIVAVVDVFDALVSERPYKLAFSLEKAFAIIESEKGVHFDPKVVDAFFEVKDQIIDIYNSASPVE